MEIEAKWVVPDRDTFDRLSSLTTIGEYAVKEPAARTLTDHYLDTAGGLILRGGFACRLRHNHTRGTWVGSLKGLGGADGAFHIRAEHEVAVSPNAPPDQWPPSSARDLALSLSQSQPLVELFAIHQTRRVGLICLRDHTVAELSLDEVEFQIGEKRINALELEIELKESGTLADLHTLTAALAPYRLHPEPRSKFERGLASLKT